MYDAEDPGTLINEFLVSLFVPGILIFVTLWASFRLVFDDALRSVGLPRVVLQPGFGAIAGGYGRALLLIVLTALASLAYLGLYVRFLRRPLRDRGVV